MANKTYLDYAGLKRVLKHLLPGHRKIWHGTEAEWNALSAAERDKYDQAEIKGISTDAYEDGYHTFDPSGTRDGITVELVNDVPCSYFRNGQLLIVNFHCKVSGTSTITQWHEYFDRDSLIGPDEYLNIPWFVGVTPLFANNGSQLAALGGNMFWLPEGESINALAYFQVVYLVKKR